MKKPTLATAKRLVKAANPGITGIAVAWSHKPTLCPLHSGGEFWSSVVTVSAAGYRTKNQVLTVDAEGTWLR